MSAPEPTPRFSGRTVSAPLPVRSRPRTGRWLVHRAEDGRTVLLSPTVLETAYRVEEDHAPAETGGLLFGRAFVDSEGPYVVVSHATRPRAGEVIGAVSTVRITRAGADAMTERTQAQHFEADVVGWYHTHPSFEAYFSAVDKAEQHSWASALAVGLVVAGVARRDDRYKIYVGPDSATTRLHPGLGRGPAIEFAPALHRGPTAPHERAHPATSRPRLARAAALPERPYRVPREPLPPWPATPALAGTPASHSPPVPGPVPAGIAPSPSPSGDVASRPGSELASAVTFVTVGLVILTICALIYFVTHDPGPPPSGHGDVTPAQVSPVSAKRATGPQPGEIPGVSVNAGSSPGPRP